MKIRPKAPTAKSVLISGYELPVFPRPSYADDITVPQDITQLDSQSVSRLMGRLTSIQAWVGQQQSDLEMKLARTENALDAAKSSIYEDRPQLLTTRTKNQKEDVLGTYPEVQQLSYLLRSLHATKRQHELMASSLERLVMVLSRELSRKTASRDGFNFEKSRRV